ncbi:MAG: GNAT family N-acetyltransferase [Planctomycetota bacterium]|nr:GNAT family N-acetyltransferase [Planctomycetota bacterium]
MSETTIPKERSHRFEAADANEAVEGLKGLQRELGPKAGVVFETFGRAVAIIGTCLDTSLYNRVIGFDAELIDQLDEVIAFYRAHELPTRFDLIPELGSTDLTNALRSRGFKKSTKPIFSNQMVYCKPRQDIPEPGEGVTIREVDVNDAALLGRVHAEGLTYPSPIREYLGLQLKERIGQPDAYGFLALVDGEPAASGLLSVVDGMGYLGHASTKPEFRGRGAQTALINARQRKACALGCDHVVTFSLPGSASQRNVQRCGFIIAHELDIWMDIEVERE